MQLIFHLHLFIAYAFLESIQKLFFLLLLLLFLYVKCWFHAFFWHATIVSEFGPCYMLHRNLAMSPYLNLAFDNGGDKYQSWFVKWS